MRRVLLLLLPILAFGIWATAVAEESSSPGDRNLQIRTLVSRTGGRVDWRDGLIVFDKMGKDGWFEIWTMKPDGSGQQCLSCESPVPRLHNGNPAWHPSGRFLVFQSLDPEIKAPLAEFGIYRVYTGPGAGFHNNVWVMTDDGKEAWQLTHVGRDGGVLHPHFSHDGSTLVWAEMTSTRPMPLGTWVIRKAAFAVEGNRPVLKGTETLTPGNLQFYETHGFTPGDDSLLFTGMKAGGAGKDFDIYIYHLATNTLQALTDPTMDEWDEHAHVSPDGDKIIWMSSMGNGLQPRQMNQFQLKTDYWIMNLDGSGKKRLTRFNVPGAAEYIRGRTIAADVSWSPDGKSVVAYVQDNATKDQPGSIVLIEGLQ
jgi:Tol biopolymer transport system component